MPRSPKRDKKGAKVKDIWLQLLTRQRDMEIAAKENAEKDLDEALAAALKGPENQKDVESKEGENASPGGEESTETKEGEEDGGEDAVPKVLTPEEIAAAEAKKKEEEAKAAADQEAKELMALKPQEHVLIVCGAKAGGKTTFVQNFLNPSKDSNIKPTTALEYSFGRKARGTVKDVVHVWELGGGLKLKDMLMVPITPANIATVAIVITLDLSEAPTALPTLIKWLKLVREQYGVLIEDLKQSKEEFKKTSKQISRMEKTAKLRVLQAADSDHVKPTAIPVVIVCTKMDIFMEQATNKRKALFNALRYHAHANGASIIAVSKKDKTQVNFLRGILNHYAFGNPFKSTTILESQKAIVVPAGSDSFEAIGLPGGCDSQEAFIAMSPNQRAEAWKHTLEEFFEIEEVEASGEEEKTGEKEDDLQLAPEPTVDAMVKQKEDELQKYRKEAERKRRLAAKDPKKRNKH